MLQADAARKVLKQLALNCPDATTALRHRNPFELLVATILSAQCTDKRVNLVTPALFRDLKTPQDFAAIPQRRLETYIQTCGLYKSKAQHIRKASQQILTDFHGRVPRTVAELQTLAGVGKKTANVVASVAFDVPAIAVDTHVFRVSNRIGLAHAKTPAKTEEQLHKVIPKKDWSKAHHWIIHHGRSICYARKPRCPICPVRKWCEYYHESGIIETDPVSRQVAKAMKK